MLTSLKLTNFRSFRSFSIEKLARVNLFVGVNNAGKTCVLEGAELLLSGGDPRVLLRSARRRGETLLSEEPRETQVDVRHLFHGHILAPGAQFSLEGKQDGDRLVAGEVVVATERDPEPIESPKADHSDQLELPVETPNTEDLPAFSFQLIGPRFGNRAQKLRLSSLGGLAIPLILSSRLNANVKDERPVRFLGTDAFNSSDLSPLWDELVLTAEEDSAVNALRLIEPSIERIALASRFSGSRGAFFIKLSSSNQRLPLGSMGDGVKRLLALSLHLARSAGGSLMIDEVDTGLHYSVMVRMWRLVIETAKRLDLQVFASTHSLDCILALAELYEQAPELGGELLLHRVERGEQTPMTYTADELHVAAEQHMEVR